MAVVSGAMHRSAMRQPNPESLWTASQWSTRMSNRILTVAAISALGSSLYACGSPNPVAPGRTSAVQTSAAPVSATIGSGGATNGQSLTAILGTGSGVVNVAATAAVDGSFSAQINVNVHGAAADTTFYVQRAPEIGRPLGSDGVCQRAEGNAPWGPPTPSFVTFPLPAAGPLVTLRTSPAGAGAVHIDFAAPTILDGTRFDVMFRLVDSLSTPTNELRTGCFTVDVR